MKHHLLAILGLSAATFLTACVNQEAEVRSYRKILDGPDANAAATQPVLSATLTLEDALRLANANNDDLQLSGEDYVQALIAKDRAAETFLPSISLNPTMTRQEEFTVPPSPPGGFDFHKFLPQNYTDVPLKSSISTSLVRDLYDVSRAAKTVEQRKALLLDLQSSVLLNVARTYYSILESEQSVRTLTTSLSVQDARVQNVTHRFDQGVARKLDVLQSQADASATRVQLTDAKNDVVKGRATLAYLLGKPSIDGTLVDHFTPPDTIATPEALLETARQKREDLAAAAEAVKASAAAVNSAWGQYFPSVGVNLNTFLYRESFPTDSWWSALFSLNLPIFEEGIIHNNVREAYSQFRQAVIHARQVDSQINEDVRTADSDYLASGQRMSDLLTETDASRRAYDAASHSFTEGTATNLDVLTSQNTQLSSQLRLDTETYNRKIAYLNLLRLTGQLNRETIDQLAAQPLNTAPTLQSPAPPVAPTRTITTITTTTITTTTTTVPETQPASP